MKIGLLASFYPRIRGGAEAGLDVLVDGFHKVDFRYNLWSLDGSGKHAGRSVIPIPIFWLVPRKVKILGLHPLDYLIATYVSSIIETSELDVLHAQDTYCLPGAIAGAKRSNTPVVLSYHNTVGIPVTSFDVPSTFASLLSRRENTILSAAAKCSAVIADSEYTADSLVKAGLSKSRVKTIYIDGAMSQWADKRASNRQRGLRVLAVGRLQHHKGFHILLEAAKRLIMTGMDVSARIAGEGPARADLSRLARSLKVSDQVKFLGWIRGDDLRACYDWSDVLVVPSLTPEPFGRVAVEAMSRGKLVIGSDVGGLPEIITEGDTGFLVEPGNPAQLAEKLLSLGVEKGLTEKMGHHALEQSRQKFDQISVTRQVIDVYQNISK